jgi:hypothetical protein
MNGTTEQAAPMAPALLSLRIVDRLDRITATATACDTAPHPLTSYSQIIDYALHLAGTHGTADQWAHASREELHAAANAGPLTLVDVEAGVLRAVEEALSRAQDVVLYTPTTSTAIAWLLDVARSAGYPVPGDSTYPREDRPMESLLLRTDDPEMIEFFTDPMRLPAGCGGVSLAERVDDGVMITRPDLLRDLADDADGKIDDTADGPFVWISGLDYPLDTA